RVSVGYRLLIKWWSPQTVLPILFLKVLAKYIHLEREFMDKKIIYPISDFHGQTMICNQPHKWYQI
ncbi:hypothetical protein, partial [Moorena sp. SIO3I8]|uniref:hypothetical protein n=1 Tax=Moorena sp. SIO3I8 TaxID=2607833 RepID=UPI0025F9BDFE